ncbi:MAG: response regulator [PVC group bacterium]|nr:response regulator [PVC group bacterium]
MLKILVVDDEPEITQLLKNFFLRKNYDVLTANNGSTAVELVKTERPHLVFLDIRMPQMNGLTALRHIRALDKSVKVIMVTALEDEKMVQEAAELGAVDYVRKPFNLDYLERDVIEKVNAKLFVDLRSELEEKSKLIDQLANQVEQISDLNEKLKRNFYQTIVSLATALEARDRYTHGHSDRVDLYSKVIAEELRDSKQWEIDDLFLDALHVESRLHDIGKIAIPDMILNKPGVLTEDEYAQIKNHPVQSAKILTPLEDLKKNIEVIRHHHERVDGRGYPDGLKHDEIPARARIIAIADAFDAMTSDRPYRKAMSIAEATDQLEKGKGAQFDAEVVDAFKNAIAQGKIPN